MQPTMRIARRRAALVVLPRTLVVTRAGPGPDRRTDGQTDGHRTDSSNTTYTTYHTRGPHSNAFMIL